MMCVDCGAPWGDHSTGVLPCEGFLAEGSYIGARMLEGLTRAEAYAHWSKWRASGSTTVAARVPENQGVLL